MSRTKLYKIIIVFLLVINCGTLAFFMLGGPPHHPPRPGDLAEKLGIDGEKKQTIFKLEKKHHSTIRGLMDQDRKLHEQLFSHLGTGFDVTPIHVKIERNNAEIEKLTYAFFHDISAFCTPEQKVELKKMINRRFHHKGPRK